MREIQDSISDKQQEKIEQSYNKNMDRLAGSETFKVIEADVALFGSEAFAKSDRPER